MQRQHNPYLDEIKKTQDDLVINYQPALKAMAFRLKERLPASIDVNDLISIGTEELIKLSRRYDETQNDNFWGYARKRVYGSMLDYLRSIDPLSRNNRKIIKDIEAISVNYFTEFNEEPSDEYLAQELNIEVEKIKEAKISQAISYTMPLDEQLEFASSEDVNERLNKEVLIEEIIKILSELKEREQLVIQLYFYEELSLKEISEILNVSESRICQIQNKVLGILRQRLGNG